MIERKLLAEGGIIDYHEHFLSKEEADNLFLQLKNIDWEQKEYTDRKTGEKFKQPRLTAWFADNSDMEYSYSGVTQKVQVWTPALLDLKSKIESIADATYNSVLLNYYRDGKDSVGYHADDEKELGINANIASLSLGSPREFLLKQYKTSDKSKPQGFEGYELTHGSLLIMSGTTQHYWKHSVPKDETGKAGPRINLTFRKFYT